MENLPAFDKRSYGRMSPRELNRSYVVDGLFASTTDLPNPNGIVPVARRLRRLGRYLGIPGTQRLQTQRGLCRPSR